MAATATKTRGGARPFLTAGDIKQRLEKVRKNVEKYDIDSFNVACGEIFPSTGYQRALLQLGMLIRDDEGIYHWNSSFRISNTSAEKLIQKARKIQNHDRAKHQTKYQKGDGKSGIKTSASGAPSGVAPENNEAVKHAADRMQTFFDKLASDSESMRADISHIKLALFDIQSYVKPQRRDGLTV